MKLAVYAVTGELVKTLVDRVQQRGAYSVTWDGRDRGGRRPPSGVYVLRLEAGTESGIAKVIMLR